MSDPQSTPLSPRAPDVAFRWPRWQAAQLAQQTLTPDAAARGYTTLKVRPSLRPAFFAVVDLLSARVRWENQAGGHTRTDIQEAWVAWQTWTRRFAAYLDRVATGRAGTPPPLPPALLALLEGQADDHG